MQLRGAWAWTILVVLFVSLGVNFFLAGFLAQRARMAGHGFAPPRLGRWVDDFPPEARREVSRRLWENREALRGTLDEIRRKRAEIAEAMRVPQLDTPRLQQLMGELRTLSNRMQAGAQDAVVQALATLSAADRARIGERRRNREALPPDEP